MKTFCNPLNLNYNIQPPKESGAGRENPAGGLWFREAADPSVVIFEGEYYLFCSVSKGYWVSQDLSEWEFIALADWKQLPNLQGFAPTAVVIDGVMYLAPGNSKLAGVFKTRTPRDPGSWVEMPNTGMPATGEHYPDAQLFYDEDTDRLYYTYGCSPKGIIHIQELDKRTFTPSGFYHEMFMPNPHIRGWERPAGPRGNNDGVGFNWVEGPQLFKHNGKYYWIYSLPDLGNCYCNGVYVADDIAGPYQFQAFNPCTQKLTGFAPGSGHGEIFKDKLGNWWTATCQSVWALEHFERRISLFPTWIDDQGQLFSDTRLGDYPTEIPAEYVGKARNSLWTGWHLLSYGKPCEASSEVKRFEASYVCDEDIQTWWSAKSGGKDEWLEIDLEQVCDIRAVQVNFAEHRIRRPEDPNPCIQYQLLVSEDHESWQLAIDKSNSKEDTPHDYVQLESSIRGRYVRLLNVHMPFGGNFAVRGLRLFGKGSQAPPVSPEFTATRNARDRRETAVEWKHSDTADGYVLRYGIRKDELFYSQQIYGTTNHTIRSLNADQDYYLTVDAFNANGYTEGTEIQLI